MKVRVLSALLAFCLVLTMVPAVGALPTGVPDPADPYLVANDVVVITENAVVGSYDTVADAVLLASDGSTLWLQNGVTEQADVTIDKAITLDGNGQTISAYETGADVSLIFSATGESTVQNVTLDGVGLEASAGTVNILSGTYTGAVSETGGTLSISGGAFATDPDAGYLAEGYTTQQNSDGLYEVVQVTVDSVAGSPYANVPDTIPETSDVINAANSVEVTEGSTELEAAAAAEAEALTPEQQTQYTDEGRAALEEALGTTVTEPVQLFVQTYISITASEHTVGTSLLLDITPMYQYVASTATTSADVEMSGDGQNAVAVPGTAQALTVSAEVGITIQITPPASLISGRPQMYVHHQIGGGIWVTYRAGYVGDTDTLQFTTYGFSPMELTTVGPEAALVGGGEYETIEDAVKAAGENAEITVNVNVDAGNTVDFTGIEKTFTLTPKDDTVTIDSASITPASGYSVTPNGADGYIHAPTTAEMHTITVTVNGGGSVTPSGSVQVPDGGSQAFTFTPAAGYELGEVTLDGAPVTVTGTSYTVSSVTADCELVVNFVESSEEPTTYTLTVTQPEEGGTIAIDEITGTSVTENADGSYTVSPDTQVTLVVTEDEIYHLSSWLVNGSANGVTDNPYSFTVDSDMEISAQFELDSTPGTDYIITVEPSDYGTITLTGAGEPDADGKYTVAANTEVTATVTANDGYRFDALLVNGEIYTTSPQSFTVTGDTTVSANFTLIDDTPDTPSGGGSSGTGGSGRYNISVPSTAHGSISLDRENAAYGTLVTITVRPDAGYELGTLTVTDRNGNEVEVEYEGGNEYSFRMPNSRVTIEATFVASGAASTGLPFTDVASSAWYYDAVRFVYENGLMNGVSATAFGPNQTTSRGMIVTILYRLEGEPAVAGSTFSDVASNAYYANAIAWASANGIVNGYGNGTFQPNRAISREEMATILYRYASYKGYSVTTNGSLSGYTDADQVSAYALEAMRWANENNLVTGTTATTLAPTTGSTRAVAATILMRFINSFAQ